MSMRQQVCTEQNHGNFHEFRRLHSECTICETPYSRRKTVCPAISATFPPIGLSRTKCTLLAIRRSLEESCGTDRQRKRSARQKSLGVDSDEFSNMSESDLRYHKYAELKLEWQDKHPGRVIPNGISYTLHEQAQAWADGVVLRKEHKTD
jgi:hypothetical protein